MLFKWSNNYFNFMLIRGLKLLSPKDTKNNIPFNIIFGLVELVFSAFGIYLALHSYPLCSGMVEHQILVLLIGCLLFNLISMLFNQFVDSIMIFAINVHHLYAVQAHLLLYGRQHQAN
jgi:hypothetical protein